MAEKLEPLAATLSRLTQQVAALMAGNNGDFTGERAASVPLNAAEEK